MLENGNGSNMVMPVGPVGGNGFGGGYGDGGWFWLIILFIICGWGNGGYGYGNGGGGVNTVTQDVQRGFDQSATMGSLNGLTSAVANGFANAEISRCNNAANLTNQLNTIAMNQQQCCCENRAAVADLKYTVATESAATRTNDQANTQMIMDKLCQLELDGVKQNYENRIAGMQSQIDSLSNALNTANTQAFVGANVSRILADNAAQTVALEQYLNPTPVPAYTVPAPFGCNCGNNYGCGCGM